MLRAYARVDWLVGLQRAKASVVGQRVCQAGAAAESASAASWRYEFNLQRIIPIVSSAGLGSIVSTTQCSSILTDRETRLHHVCPPPLYIIHAPTRETRSSFV